MDIEFAKLLCIFITHHFTSITQKSCISVLIVVEIMLMMLYLLYYVLDLEFFFCHFIMFDTNVPFTLEICIDTTWLDY